MKPTILIAALAASLPFTALTAQPAPQRRLIVVPQNTPAPRPVNHITVPCQRGRCIPEPQRYEQAPPIVLAGMSTQEFIANAKHLGGQTVTVYGKVMQAIRGMGGYDTYILDGNVRCQFRQNARCTNGAHAETGRYVSITGRAIGGHHVTSNPDLVDCACPWF